MKLGKVYFVLAVVFVLTLLVACRSNEQSREKYLDFEYQVTEEKSRVELAGAPYTIPTDNCDSDTASKKSQEVTKTFLTDLEISVSNEVAAEFGGDVAVAEAVLSGKIGTELKVKIGTQSENKSTVEVTVPAGKKNNTEVQWKEVWTEGSISVIRSDGSYVGVLPFVVLNSLVLEQLGSQTLECETNVVIAEENTPQALPTAIPRIIPTPEPKSIGFVSVLANSNDGLRFTADSAGRYEFKYSSGAYSTYPIDRIPDGLDTWLTAIRIFKNKPAQWNGEAISNSPDVSAIDFGYSSSSNEAEAKAQDKVASITLLKGEYLTLVAVDGRPYYSDNPGEVSFEVFYTPLQ